MKGVTGMNAYGIVRRIDDLGRVVIPKEIRRNLGIEDFAPMVICVKGDKIILEKYNPETYLGED